MKITKRAIMAMASFVLLLLQAFGLKIDVPVVNEVISALAGVLVILGIISDGSTPAGKDTDESGAGGETPTESPNAGADENAGESAAESPNAGGAEENAGESSAEAATGSEGSPEELPPLSDAEGDETDKNGAICGEEGEKSAEKTDNGLN